MLHSIRLFPKMVDPEYWRRLWVEIKLVGQLMKDGRVPIYTKIIPSVTVLRTVPLFIPNKKKKGALIINAPLGLQFV